MKNKILILVLLFGLVLFQGCIDQKNMEGGTEAYKLEERGVVEKVLLYKTPYCGCCSGYVDYLKRNGYEVEVKIIDNLDEIKEKYGIPYNMRSCHTSIFGNYFVEGHVPIEAVEKMLMENPDIEGIALPGMPAGSPGMGGIKSGKFEIYEIKSGKSSLFTKI